MPLNSNVVAENIDSPIEDGDAGLIIKADGSIQMFNLFGDEAGFTAAQIETGRRLIALSVALRVPKIMTILESMANDPEVQGLLH